MARQRWGQRRGQSILEYLLVASAVIAAFLAVAGIVGNTAPGKEGPIADVYNDSATEIRETGTFLGKLKK